MFLNTGRAHGSKRFPKKITIVFVEEYALFSDMLETVFVWLIIKNEHDPSGNTSCIDIFNLRHFKPCAVLHVWTMSAFLSVLSPVDLSEK